MYKFISSRFMLHEISNSYISWIIPTNDLCLNVKQNLFLNILLEVLRDTNYTSFDKMTKHLLYDLWNFSSHRKCSKVHLHSLISIFCVCKCDTFIVWIFVFFTERVYFIVHFFLVKFMAKLLFCKSTRIWWNHLCYYLFNFA